MDWIRKKFWKKSLRFPWPWKSTVKVTFHFLHKRKLEMAFQRHWCAKNGKNSEKKSSKHLWPWNRDFQSQGCLREFSYYFFHIHRVKLHRNATSNLHDKWDKFFTLHFTLPLRLVDISTTSQVGDSNWDIQWFYVL